MNVRSSSLLIVSGATPWPLSRSGWREQDDYVVLWCVKWRQYNLMKIVWWVWVLHTSSANTQWWKRPSCGPLRGCGGWGWRGFCWQIFVVLPHSWQWCLWHHRWTVAHLTCCMSSVNFVLGEVDLLYKLTLTVFSMYCATCNKGVHTKTHTHKLLRLWAHPQFISQPSSILDHGHHTLLTRNKQPTPLLKQKTHIPAPNIKTVQSALLTSTEKCLLSLL